MQANWKLILPAKPPASWCDMLAWVTSSLMQEAMVVIGHTVRSTHLGRVGVITITVYRICLTGFQWSGQSSLQTQVGAPPKLTHSRPGLHSISWHWDGWWVMYPCNMDSYNLHTSHIIIALTTFVLIRHSKLAKSILNIFLWLLSLTNVLRPVWCSP